MTRCCVLCGRPMADTAPSDYYCGPDCHTAWQANNINAHSLSPPDVGTLWEISNRSRQDETPDPLIVKINMRVDL